MPKETNIIGIVKRKLWSSGYSVAERSRAADGCDLLVDGRHRVIVCKKGEEGRIRAGLDANQYLSHVIASVHFAYSEPFVGYHFSPTEGGVNYTSSHRVAFGLPESKSKDHGKEKTRKAAKGGKEGSGA